MAETPTIPEGRFAARPAAKGITPKAVAGAVAAGFGAVLAALVGLGMVNAGSSTPAHGGQPVTQAGFTQGESNRLERIEARLNEVSDRLAHIEGRLDRDRSR